MLRDVNVEIVHDDIVGRCDSHCFVCWLVFEGINVSFLNHKYSKYVFCSFFVSDLNYGVRKTLVIGSTQQLS